MYSLHSGRQIYFRLTFIVDRRIEMSMGHSWQHKVWQNCLLKIGIVHVCRNLYVTYFHWPTVNNLNLVEFKQYGFFCIYQLVLWLFFNVHILFARASSCEVEECILSILLKKMTLIFHIKGNELLMYLRYQGMRIELCQFDLINDVLVFISVASRRCTPE